MPFLLRSFHDDDHFSAGLSAFHNVSQMMRRVLRMRSVITVGIFTAAALIALRWPVVGMALICLCLAGYLRPDVPATKDVGAEK